MNIEDTPPLDDLQGPFPKLVTGVSRQWRRALDHALQPLGLTDATWRALLHTSRATGPLHQKDLAYAMGLESSSVVRLLTTLERDGYVSRQEYAPDKRAKIIVLTDKGRATTARVEAIAQELRARVLGVIPAADLASAALVLQQVSDSLAALTSGKQP